MKTIIEGVFVMAAMLSFCAVLAWAESVPVSDAPLYWLVEAFNTLVQLIDR